MSYNGLRYSLEVVMTHLSIKSIAFHTFQTPVCKILARIKVFTGRLAIVLLVMDATLDALTLDSKRSGPAVQASKRAIANNR